ncbi:phosphatidate cytidylyltransferase [Membranicola marinus]|uniref:Phosphatidate cytidylyltransferase n=1 Tax=Membranihabitans marinus TaxID=1227546 RepID=A0A953HM63_9BACT|nr:CDP-archaeol synthase [Membranihabitans marinus]MBY5957634.1 phosphatidate cytidylyltransferase [Membranihabitans marinus]
MKDLLRRILGASIYILALLGGLYFRQPFWLLVCALLLIVAMYEWSRLQEKLKKNEIILFSGLILFLFLQFGLFLAELAYGPAWNNIAILLGIAFYLFCALAFRKDVFPRKFIPGSFFYILVPFLFLYILGLAIPPTFLLLLFCIIWTSDTFAYLGGKLFGRTKLIPSISPGKTWEGAISGILAAGIVALVVARYFLDLQQFSIWFSIGILVAIFGILGDLFESKIKRRHNIKDSGTLLPGHGGVLDRMDSLLFAIPIYYIFVTILNSHVQ